MAPTAIAPPLAAPRLADPRLADLPASMYSPIPPHHNADNDHRPPCRVYRAAAAFSASTRSVDSQEKPSRPKWP
jgi:hypothetical protein